jgi:transposase
MLMCGYNCIYNIDTMTNPSDQKAEALRRNGTLNPRAHHLTDKLFQQSDFFDARDIVQVKYEMLRRVEHEGCSISRSADAFGFSRPTFYQAKKAFEKDGLWGLEPERRGPRRAHKLTTEVVTYLEERRAVEPSLSWVELANEVQVRFQLSVHPRSIKRQLSRGQKKR